MIRSALLAALLAFPASAFAEGLTVHGSFRHMMHTGEMAGTVALDTLDAPVAWGVGATAGLKGEVVIRDGTVLASRGADPEARLQPPAPVESAVILAYGAVDGWHEVTVPHEMDADRMAHFVTLQATALGLDVEAGFPFRLTGTFTSLTWHVVTGEAPAAVGHGHSASRGAVGGHGAHANTRSGMTRFRQDGARGEIVGVHAGRAEGIASHQGEPLNLHFFDSAGERSGHVDEVAVAAGAVLMLPADAAAAPVVPADHGHAAAASSAPIETGQAAFAAIGEIVARLMADPATDWTRVDIEALRQHLIDMDVVTLRATVAVSSVDGAARFTVTSGDEAVAGSIQRMVVAHALTMDGTNGWSMVAEEIDGGAVLTVTGPDVDRIRGLGFIGLMTVGMHHQVHHLAIATGMNPHAH